MNLADGQVKMLWLLGYRIYTIIYLSSNSFEKLYICSYDEVIGQNKELPLITIIFFPKTAPTFKVYKCHFWGYLKRMCYPDGNFRSKILK